MNGQEVYKFAVHAASKAIPELCAQRNVPLAEVDWFLLHQANYRILDAIRQRLKQPAEKFPQNVHRFGNTSSASLPLLLDELNRSGRLQPGDLLAFSAFGAGLTTGACLMTW